MRRLRFLFLLAFTGFGCLESAGQEIPAVGDRFEIHFEMIASGTALFEGAPAEPIEQRMEVFASALVRKSDPDRGVELRYSFDRAIFESAAAGGSSSRLEILPGRVLIDGATVYDRERDPDVPVGLLDLLINEEMVVRLSPAFEIEEIREFRRNRSRRSFLDLKAVVLESLAPHPPAGVEVGQSWALLRPMEALGGDLTLPATETFRYNEPAAPDRPIRTLQKTIEARLEKPISLPIRLGMLAVGNLSYDALGPNLIAPPPPMKVVDFRLDSRGVIEFDVGWGFTRTSGSMANLHLECEIPPPDGTAMRKKTLQFARQTLVNIQKSPDLMLTEEERALLFGDPTSYSPHR